VQPDGKKVQQDKSFREIILKWIYKKHLAGRAWNRLIWLRIETGGGLY
jgi:hypothetical protein